MKTNFQQQLFESKSVYHKSQAKKSFEEKILDIIELQKLSIEMQNRNPNRPGRNKKRFVWEMEIG